MAITPSVNASSRPLVISAPGRAPAPARSSSTRRGTRPLTSSPRQPLPHRARGDGRERGRPRHRRVALAPDHDQPGQLAHPVPAVPLAGVGQHVGPDHQREPARGVLRRQVLEGARGLADQRIALQLRLRAGHTKTPAQRPTPPARTSGPGRRTAPAPSRTGGRRTGAARPRSPAGSPAPSSATIRWATWGGLKEPPRSATCRPPGEVGSITKRSDRGAGPARPPPHGG